MTKWIYLTDLAPQGIIINPETGDQRRIMSSAVKDKAPAGLRRHVLEEMPGGLFRETGEVLPVTESLLADMEDAYAAPNNWNFDWPHLKVEAEADEHPEMEAKVRQRLEAMMANYPYDFKITGLQRRYLMYFSDGNYHSQQRFERLVPAPTSNPFRQDGKLRKKYDWIWNSNMRDAKVPYPKDKESMYGGLTPCLYSGPAWVVRFQLDGTDVLLERCRVYVDDEANFICSDWCQRHDYTSYHNGINLQTGIYTFDGWVTGPCLVRNVEGGHFKPVNATVKREAVRNLMKKAPVAVPNFDQAFAKAKAAVDKYAKPAAAPAEPRQDAGPLNAEIMKEAEQAAAQVLKELLAKQPKQPPAPALTQRGAPTEERYEHLRIVRVPDAKSAEYGYVAAVAEHENDKNTYVEVRKLYEGYEYKDYSPDVIDLGVEADEHFVVDAESPTGFWYGQEAGNNDDDDYDYVEPLNDHWWLYHVAVHYRDHVMDHTDKNAVMATLLGEN